MVGKDGLLPWLTYDASGYIEIPQTLEASFLRSFVSKSLNCIKRRGIGLMTSMRHCFCFQVERSVLLPLLCISVYPQSVLVESEKL